MPAVSIDKFYIYIIQNKINLKIYVGQTYNPKVRWSTHKKDTKRFNYPIHKALRKYGYDNFTFTVIEEHPNKEDVDVAEKFWINFFNSTSKLFGYNVQVGGGTGSLGLKASSATKNKMSISHQGTKDDVVANLTVANRGSKNAASLLNEEKVLEIKQLLMSGKFQQKEIAEKFGVSKSTIGEISRGALWAHVWLEGFSDRKIRNRKNIISEQKFNTITEIRLLHQQGLTTHQLHEKYNLSKEVILDIINYRTYK